MFGIKRRRKAAFLVLETEFEMSPLWKAVCDMHMEDWKHIGTMEHAQEVQQRLLDNSHAIGKPPWED